MSGNAAAEELTTGAALAAAKAAAHYMVSAETADGRFLYEFDFLLGRFVDDDNIVRQSGAGYGLNEYVSVTHDPAIIEPARRATVFAQSRSVSYGSGKLVSSDGTPARGSSGATALAALGAIYSLRTTDDAVMRSAVKEWLAGLEAVQLPDGAFPTTADKIEQDSYGSGEAWLALAHWVELEPGDASASLALNRAEIFLMSYYRDHPDLQFFHWGLQAGAKRYETTGDKSYLAFLDNQIDAYLTKLAPQLSIRENNCAAVEGFAAALGAMGKFGSDPLIGKVRERMSLELEASMQLQLQPGQERMTYGPDRFYQDPKLANFAGAFLNGGASLRTRIDATQHCLGALLAFAQGGAP